MAGYTNGDLTITASASGGIASIRGEKLPNGMVFSPMEPNMSSTIPASAMLAMSAALHWAEAVRQKATAVDQRVVDG